MFPYDRFARKAIRPHRSPLFTLFAVLVLALCFALIANAAAGDLDTSFSTDGWQTTNFFNDTDMARDVALQSDGKIISVGHARRNGQLDFAVTRYKTDGSLDATFSGDGKLTTDLVGHDVAMAIAIQSNGKIVVAGYSTSTTNSGQSEFALARYNSNGALDTTFDRDGKVKTDFFGGIDTVFAVAIQPDGKIVAVGRSETALGSRLHDLAIARYNSNGTLDTTFDADGKVTTDFFGRMDTATGVRILQDGKILATGYVTNANIEPDVALARYNTDGSLDKTFSGDGKHNTDFARTSDHPQSVLIQPDQKIVLAGFLINFNTGFYSFAVARYNPNGTLDRTFSGDGKQITSFAGLHAKGYDVALQPDGKIVVIGETLDANNISEVALVRYNSNGALDTSFSGDGRLTAKFIGDQLPLAGAIQPDGKLIVAGTASPTNQDSTKYDFMLARFHLSGQALTAASSDGDSQQLLAAPVTPASDRSDVILDSNPDAGKPAAGKPFKMLSPMEDPTAELEW